jgi:mono/diheme cytochrome c family protein
MGDGKKRTAGGLSGGGLHRLMYAAGALLAVTGLVLGAYLFWPEPELRSPTIGSLGSSLEQGRYLATIGNCQTCHTASGGKPFAGGMKFLTDFGVLYSTNITSERETGIGGWSFEDFYQAMKRGVRPDGAHLYPAFPYTSFARLTDADIGSLYLFTKSIEPAHAEARPNELKFPYNLRFGLRAWNRLFHDQGAYAADPTKSTDWNRGAYLVQGIGHCGGCHTPRNFLGAERSDLALSGGVLYDEVRPGKYRQWSAVNLTPAKNGLGGWSAQSITEYLKRGQCERAVVQGPMNEVVMNSTRYLADADVHAIATYLKGLSASSRKGGRGGDPQQLAAGEVTYTVHCGTCHLPTGLGDEVLGVRLAGNAIVQATDPASLINVILYGPHLPPPPFVADRTRMKPFGKRLSDEDIANLATYVRANFGNQAGAVSSRQVVGQR